MIGFESPPGEPALLTCESCADGVKRRTIFLGRRVPALRYPDSQLHRWGQFPRGGNREPSEALKPPTPRLGRLILFWGYS